MGSIILGVIAAFFVICSLIPFFGILNVISIPLLIIGLILGILGIVKKEQEKKGVSIAGTIICGIFLLLALVRVGIGASMTQAILSAKSNATVETTAIEQMKGSFSLDELPIC